jgi:hypothetical protein
MCNTHARHIGDPDVISTRNSLTPRRSVDTSQQFFWHNTMDPDNNVSTEVARVAVRLPAFWPNRPAAWFTAPNTECNDLKHALGDLSRQASDLREEQVHLDASLRRISTSDRRPRFGSRRSTGPRDNAPTADSNSTLCWYHRRHGAQAQRCTKSCTFRLPEN